MRRKAQSVKQLIPGVVRTRKSLEGNTVYDESRRMWVTFTDPEKEKSFWLRLNQREEGRLGL